MKSFFKSFLKLSIVAIIPFSASSCFFDGGDRQENDEHFRFINEIEFSIAGYYKSDSHFSLGTAWAYKAINEYKYQLITNYHVYDGIKNCDYLYFGFNKYEEREKAIGISEISKNMIIGQTALQLNPFFIETKQTQSHPGYLDICSIDIDFSQTVNSKPKLKDKLDKIYSKRDSKNLLLKISDTKYSNTRQNVYFAGYPWATSDVSRDYTYFAQWRDKISRFEYNALNTFRDGTYDTFQDQYWLPGKNNFLLGGGASGSLLINENYEAIGIYWGGGKSSNYFYPSLAMFYMGKQIADGTGKKYEIDFFYSLNDRR